MMSNAWARRGGDRSRPVGAAEIDVFEGYGTIRGLYRTTHRHVRSRRLPFTPDAINSTNWQPRRVDLIKRFHTDAMRRTPAR
jgi:hypothetical protein